MIQDPASMAGGPDGRPDVHGFPGRIELRQERRRITAESFRLLTARLKAKTVPAGVSLDVNGAVPAPATKPLTQPEPYRSEPETAMPEVIVPESALVAPEQVAQLPFQGAFTPSDIILPSFEPLWPMEPEPAKPDLSVGAEDISDEEPDESVAPAMQVAPVVLSAEVISDEEPDESVAPEMQVAPVVLSAEVISDEEPDESVAPEMQIAPVVLSAEVISDEEPDESVAPEMQVAPVVLSAEVISDEEPDESVVPKLQVAPVILSEDDFEKLAFADEMVEPMEAETAQANVSEPEPELVLEAADIPSDIQPDVVLEAEKPAQPLAERAQPLAERVVDAMLQTVTEAIYAKPTGTERAAFMAEIAAEIESDEESSEVPEGPIQHIATAPESVQMTVSTIEPPTLVQEPEDIPGTLVDKLGPSAALLLKHSELPDPFSKTAKDAIRLASESAEMPEADEDSGELALSLLDMMSAGAASGLPQERALAADTLLRMIPRVPAKQLILVGERVAIMEAPPSLLVAKLIRDPRAEVVAPLLERCMHITDQDLMTAATEGDSTKRRMIARRRVLSPVLADHLIAIGDPSTVLTLIRNPGASFSHDAFYRLAEHASQHHSLLAPLTTRADLPAPVAFELFWFVPQELRRFIFSRFLTDSETLSKILKITLGAQDGGETKFPPKELLDSVIDKAVAGKIDEAAQKLADIGGICQETATRILADPHGEPVSVLLKALGYPRAKLAESMERFKHSDCKILRPGRNIAELESIFDTLSFTKARILLTYWDWFVQKSGPYAPQN